MNDTTRLTLVNPVTGDSTVIAVQVRNDVATESLIGDKATLSIFTGGAYLNTYATVAQCEAMAQMWWEASIALREKAKVPA